MSEVTKNGWANYSILRARAPGLPAAVLAVLTVAALGLSAKESHDNAEEQKNIRTQGLTLAREYTETLNAKGATDGVLENVQILPGFVSLNAGQGKQLATAVNPLLLSGSTTPTSHDNRNEDLDGAQLGVLKQDDKGRLMIVPVEFDKDTSFYTPASKDNYLPRVANVYATEISEGVPMLHPYSPSGEKVNDFYPTNYVGQYVQAP